MMNGSANGTVRGIRKSAVFVCAIGLFFCAGNVIGQTSGSLSNAFGSPANVNDHVSQPEPRYQRLAADIISDTQGVDFAPYMRQTLSMIKKSWVSSLPEEVAQAKNSRETVIRFTISRDGAISAMELVESAHQLGLDRAAWGSITGVAPLPSLPAGFNGPSLILRIHFRENPPQQ
jgi:TonB family protein